MAIYKFVPCLGTKFRYVLFISSTGLLTWHGVVIPEDKIFVKLGGDHGQKSMKLNVAFQLANVHIQTLQKILQFFLSMRVKTLETTSGL